MAFRSHYQFSLLRLLGIVVAAAVGFRYLAIVRDSVRAEYLGLPSSSEFHRVARTEPPGALERWFVPTEWKGSCASLDVDLMDVDEPEAQERCEAWIKRLPALPEVDDVHIYGGGAAPKDFFAMLAARCPQCTWLALTDVDGGFTDDDLASLAAFREVEHLNLTLTAPRYAGPRTLPPAVWDAIAALPRLDQLNLVRTTLGASEIEELAKLRRLRTLRLTSPKYELAAASATVAPDLETLELGGGCDASGLPAELLERFLHASERNLKELEFDQVELSARLQVDAARLLRLETLKVHKVSLDAAWLAQFEKAPALHTFIADDVPVDDATVEVLLRMKQLRKVGVKINGLSPEGFERLRNEPRWKFEPP